MEKSVNLTVKKHCSAILISFILYLLSCRIKNKGVVNFVWSLDYKYFMYASGTVTQLINCVVINFI